MVEAEKEEMTVLQDMRANLEEQNPEQGTMPSKKKAVKASMTWILRERETRRTQPTKRYGIDVAMQVDEKEISKMAWKEPQAKLKPLNFQIILTEH